MMKIEVNRLAMLEAAKCAEKIAPSNSPVDVLNGILVEGNDDTGEVFLTATNHEVSIQQKVIASVESGGAMLINARMLVGMMSLLDGEFVTLTAEKSEIINVTGGRCTYKINCLPSKSYPKPIMPFPEESVIMTGICSLAKRTAFLVSKDDNKPALQCVNVKLKNNAVHAAASNGFGIMLTKDSTGPTVEQEFLLPGRSLSILASVSKDSDVFEVGDIGNEVVFVRGDMIFTIRKLVTSGYIDTNALLKSVKSAYTAVTDAGKMKEALNVVSVSAFSGATHVPVNLMLSGGEIVLRCNNDFSEGSTVIPANISQDTPETGFFYDVSALMKIFNILIGKVKLEIDAKGFMMVKTRNEVYLQSPVRPPVKKTEPAPTKETKRAKGAEEMKEKEAA